jgi:hypothetical protein
LTRFLALALLLLSSFPALPLSQEGKEFLAITKELEPVQCEKRRLRREIALAEAEKRETTKPRARFAELDRDPKTTKLERRLAVLEKRMSNGKGGTLDPEDLAAISRQQREAFYRCE